MLPILREDKVPAQGKRKQGLDQNAECKQKSTDRITLSPRLLFPSLQMA